MSDDTSVPFHTLGFEPLQHEYIGNSVKLKYSEDSKISGKDFNFGGFKLSFGRIIALAGDFFAHYTVGLGDIDQLSDNWYIYPERSVKLAEDLAEHFFTEGKYLGRLNELLEEQGEKLQCAIKEGLDIAHASTYSGIASDYNVKYIDATKADGDEIGSCQRIALCNWDNFGKNAIKAYMAAHRAALQKSNEAKTSSKSAREAYKTALDTATKAHEAAFNEARTAYERALDTAVNDNKLPSDDEESLFLKITQEAHVAHVQAINDATSKYTASIKKTLDQVYVREAIAQHYLSVLFLAGHLRTPRRELHKVFYGSSDYPMDRCAQVMHDEDNANGLWVTNKDGDAWWMYGDQQLWYDIGSKNFEIAMAAAQASVDEIWATRISGVIPLTYKALNKVPILDRLDPPYNYTPLFRQAPGTDLIIHQRATNSRDNILFTPVWTFESHRGHEEWTKALSRVGNQSSHQATEPFEVSDVIWDLKVTQKGLVVNWYCSHLSPIDPLGPWGIRRQSIIPHNVPDNFTTIFADQVGDNGYCFVFGCVGDGSGKDSNYCFRVRIELSKFMEPSILWTQIFQAEAATDPPKVVHRKLLLAMYWVRGGTDTEVEVYSISDSSTNSGMTKNREYKFSYPIDFVLFYTIKRDRKRDYICCYRYDQDSRQTSWIFGRPPQRDDELSLSHPITWKEVDLALPAECILPLDHHDDPWLIRLFYGLPDAENEIRIDVIRFDKVGNELKRTGFKTQTFEFKEAGADIRWYMGDVSLKQQRRPDLIALVIYVDLIRTIVFPNQGEAEPSFGQPIISDIACPFKVMRSVRKIRQVNTRFGSDAGFLFLLDNGGTLGVQYLCPVNNSYEYRLGGRVPAVAGTYWGSSGSVGTGNEPRSIGNSTSLGVLRGKLDPPGNEIYKYFTGLSISKELLGSCAELYKDYFGFGVWSAVARNPGDSIDIDETILEEQYLSSTDKDRNVLITCHNQDQKLIGYVLATVWDYDGGVVGWVTQLVVLKQNRGQQYRRRYIATHLIQMLERHNLFQNITAIGIASHQPAACRILARLKSRHVGSVNLKFGQLNARKILEKTPVLRLQNRSLRGSLFEEQCEINTVSLIDTQFYVDHTEALELLKTFKEENKWNLGKLLEGHEFLLILEW